MKKIPYGISDYRTIVDENYLYVDKTKHIEILEEVGEPFIFFLRPRRFGKSLFTSVLECYYDLAAEEQFHKLFGHTYIGKKPTSKKNAYYIMKFNFSGINTDTKENLLEGFRTKVLNGLKDFTNRYKPALHEDYRAKTMPSEIFSTFINDIAGTLEGKIYVLIDEYDHFANELLSYQVELFKETVSQTGFVRKWYEELKNATSNGFVQRIFATGVSPVTLDSLTSGFNIAKNKSMNYKLNECMGFTEKEVRGILQETLGLDFDIDREMPVLKKYYNGYLFSKKGNNRIFNSDMILYYASERQGTGEAPEQLIDANISSDYNKMAKLFMLGNSERNMEILEDIVRDKQQTTLITSEFSLAKEFTGDDFNSLLYYLGFLTIQGGELLTTHLVVPNYVIKELYFDFFGKVIRDWAQVDIDVTDIRRSIEKMALGGKVDAFLQLVGTTLGKLSTRDFIKFDEKYVKAIMVTYLMMSRIYYVKSEYEVEGGYVDIALLPRPGMPAPYHAIFEVKYLKKEDCSPATIEKKVVEAKAEIARYTSSEELMSLRGLKKWIVVWCKDKLAHVEEV